MELVIFVVEGTHAGRRTTKWSLNKLRDGKTPVILAVNKVDNVQEKADSAAAPAVAG